MCDKMCDFEGNFVCPAFPHFLLNGASMTMKHCLPKNRGKVRNLSISMVSFHISHSFQCTSFVLIENKCAILINFLIVLKKHQLLI